jgi:hypothetical protein
VSLGHSLVRGHFKPFPIEEHRLGARELGLGPLAQVPLGEGPPSRLWPEGPAHPLHMPGLGRQPSGGLQGFRAGRGDRKGSHGRFPL